MSELHDQQSDDGSMVDSERTAEMRRVIEHAAQHARAARAVEEGRQNSHPARPSTLVSLAYIEGVLDMLGTYLQVQDR